MILIMFMLIMFGLIVCMTELFTLDVLSESIVICTVPTRFYRLERPDILHPCLDQRIVLYTLLLMLEINRPRQWLTVYEHRILLGLILHRLYYPDPPFRPPKSSQSFDQVQRLITPTQHKAHTIPTNNKSDNLRHNTGENIAF